MRDAVAQELDAARPAVFDDDPRRMRVGADRQVRTPPRLVQIGARRAPAPLAVGRALEGAGAFLLAIVEIVVARQPGLDPRGNESIGQFPADRLVHDAQRPAGAVCCARAALLVLGFLEIGQHAVPIPAGAAALPPEIVIGRVAAHIDHAVDRAGAAQHLAARLVHAAAFELRLGLALEHPVEARIGEQPAVADRDMDPEKAVLVAGLEQQHTVAAAFAEPGGDGATGRAGAGDDVVVGAGLYRRAVGLHQAIPSPPRNSFSTWSRLRVCQRRRRPIGSFSISGYTFS